MTILPVPSIQNIPLEDLAHKFDLPLYVYDSEVILKQYKKLKGAFQKNPVRILYAIKALSNVNILNYLKEIGAQVDAVSVQEIYLAIKAGFSTDQILFTPSCVSFEEIQKAIDLKVLVNIDNLQMLEYFGHKYGKQVPCCIRLNPHIQAGGNSKIQVGHIDSKFGISIFQLLHIKKLVDLHDINIIGLHMHTGSDILDGDVFIKAAEVLFEASKYFPNLKFMDFGSGFKVAYRENDIVTDVVDLGIKMDNYFSNFVKSYGKPLEIWFEPGKFLVSKSGYFLTKVNVVKHTPAGVIVGVDSGLNHLIRPMMYGGYHHITNISNPKGKEKIYTVVGYICEIDTFGNDRRLNEVREGDVLALHNAGAYGYSMSSNYNSRFRPAEVFIKNNQAHLIRKRETMDDILRNQVLIED